eukprot:7205334-Prymnesium_polylepis.1
MAHGVCSCVVLGHAFIWAWFGCCGFWACGRSDVRDEAVEARTGTEAASHCGLGVYCLYPESAHNPGGRVATLACALAEKVRSVVGVCTGFPACTPLVCSIRSWTWCLVPR